MNRPIHNLFYNSTIPNMITEWIYLTEKKYLSYIVNLFADFGVPVKQIPHQLFSFTVKKFPDRQFLFDRSV